MHHQSPGAERAPLSHSAIAFRDYLHRHHLEPLDVAVASGVRYLLIWRVWTGAPISRQHEQPIRHALLRLTGEPYTAPILIHEQVQSEDAQQHKTVPLRRVR